MAAIRHGTTAGYREHQRREEKPCDACVRAKQEYDASWRGIADNTRRNRLHAKAQTRALKRLKHLHPGLYALLYAEEKERAYREAGEPVRAVRLTDSRAD